MCIYYCSIRNRLVLHIKYAVTYVVCDLIPGNSDLSAPSLPPSLPPFSASPMSIFLFVCHEVWSLHATTARECGMGNATKHPEVVFLAHAGEGM